MSIDILEFNSEPEATSSTEAGEATEERRTVPFRVDGEEFLAYEPQSTVTARLLAAQHLGGTRQIKALDDFGKAVFPDIEERERFVELTNGIRFELYTEILVGLATAFAGQAPANRAARRSARTTKAKPKAAATAAE